MPATTGSDVTLRSHVIGSDIAMFAELGVAPVRPALRDGV
jgi:hypothetical protein